MDFTINKYKLLLQTLIDSGLHFFTFEGLLKSLPEKFVVLRHDVDLKPLNSLRFAELEHSLGICANYMFRRIGESNNPEVISKIVDLGHELGYHYETLSIHNGDFSEAMKSFRSDLEYFRRFYPVKVISMHGNPRSHIDNRLLWREYDYQESGIICEPYFDIDYSKVLYLTDTGRSWKSNKTNLRDKVKSGFGITEGQPLSDQYRFKSTHQIIKAIENKELPDGLIINTHPQRWTNKSLPWLKELIFQNTKNIVKYLLNRYHKQVLF